MVINGFSKRSQASKEFLSSKLGENWKSDTDYI